MPKPSRRCGVGRITKRLQHAAIGEHCIQPHQLLHRRHGLRDGNGVVRPVQLVEVDVANAQALEALIRGLQQVSAPEVPRQRLRREEHPVPDTTNCLADDLFCSVGLCGVDQMGAELDRLPER